MKKNILTILFFGAGLIFFSGVALASSETASPNPCNMTCGNTTCTTTITFNDIYTTADNCSIAKLYVRRSSDSLLFLNEFPFEVSSAQRTLSLPVGNYIMGVSGWCVGESWSTLNIKAATGCATPPPTPTPTPTPTPAVSCPTCYFNMQTAQSSSGVVSKGIPPASFGGNISSKMSVPGWQVEDMTEVLTQPVYDYAFFDAKISSPVVLTGTPTGGELNGLNGFYKVGGSGDLTINNNFNIGSGKQIIILVPGNLRVNNQVSVDEGSFLAFIVAGDIVFDKNLGVNPNANPNSTKLVDGVYIANGFIRTIPVGETPDTNKKFIGKGMFIAGAKLDGTGGFDLRRDLGASNTTFAAESFEYRPDFLVNFPRQLGVRRISWKEVAP